MLGTAGPVGGRGSWGRQSSPVLYAPGFFLPILPDTAIGLHNNNNDRVLFMSQDVPESGEEEFRPRHEPATNIPAIILALGGVMLVVHILTQFLGNEALYDVYLRFAFIPATYVFDVSQLPYPMARFWSAVSYIFLHGDWVHLLVNLTMFAAFGSATARRFGPRSFLVFMILASVASAAAHLVTNWASIVPVIGASGAVSACMGAAVRFGFSPNQRSGYHQPALSLVQALTNRNTMPFVVIWFAFNWLFGAGIVSLSGVDSDIAWEAHVGGFVFGLLAFAFFDRKTPRDFYRV